MIPTAIDLFAGCGGMSTGVLDAGIQVVAGFDHDKPSIVAFNYNHEYRSSRGYVMDLVSASGEVLLETAQIPSVDLVVGGPPCQPFSLAGKRAGLDDKRGNLVFRFADLVEEIRPSAFVFENVPNFASMEDGKLAHELQDRLAGLGFAVTSTIINAADYGVPQARKRFILVGVPRGTCYEFPSPTHSDGSADLFEELKPFVTASDAIGDLPDVDDPRSRDIPNHEPTMHSAKMLEAFRALQPGSRDRKSFHDRLHPDRVGYTLRAGSGNFSPLRPVHYLYDRVITVRESARLQGFSDDFIWPDPLPRLQQYRQVGNAVPPPLGFEIGRSIGNALGWKLDPEATRGDSSSRPPAFVTTYEERHAARLHRLRGASLGSE